MPVCAQTISTLVKKGLNIANICVCEYCLGAVACAVLVAGASLVSILQVGDWAIVSTQARPYFLCISLQ